MGISAIGVSVGGIIVAPIAGLLVANMGWRAAWLVLGVGMIVILTPAAALLMRRQPSDVGLVPDGSAPTVDKAAVNSVQATAAPISEPDEYP